MANFGDFRGSFDAMIAFLKRIDRNTRCIACGSSRDPIAAVSGDANPATVPAGYTSLTVTKTNGSGSVVITFPNGNTYTLTADGEVFEIKGDLKEFTIEGQSGGTFKYMAY